MTCETVRKMDMAKPCSIQTLELCCRAALWEGSKAEGVQNPFPWEQSALWESADFEGLSAWCWSRICPRALLAVRVSGWQDEGWDLPSPTQEPLPQWGAQDPCPPPALPMQGSDQSQGMIFIFTLTKLLLRVEVVVCGFWFAGFSFLFV